MDEVSLAFYLLGDQNPHYIVPNIEMSSLDSWPHLTSPRLLSTHLPLHALPRQIPDDDQLKIVYVTRNPRDTFVSFWKFWERLAESAVKLGIQRHIPKEVLLEKYCAGHFHGGPFSDNVLSYLRESRRRPDKVLFVTYEDLHADCQGVICKIGNFLEYPSDVVEGNVSQIAKHCSFRNISSLDINKKDESSEGLYPPNSTFFRSGETGGWREHFTPAMIERMRQEIEQKLDDEGLYFDYT